MSFYQRRRQRRRVGAGVSFIPTAMSFSPLLFLLLVVLLLLLHTPLLQGGVPMVATALELTTPYTQGDPSCPCAYNPQTGLDPIDARDVTNTLLMNHLGPGINLTTYGVGCDKHDWNILSCSDADDCSPSSTVTPSPVDCDRSWCNRSWCFVDPANCTLLHALSPYFTYSNRYYSYATCWDMDSFTQNNRLGALDGTVLNVGFNSNSGGWTGAYSSDGQHFKGPIRKWSGPVVEFVLSAARIGGFRINVTEPPPFLLNRSQQFFNSASKFDYCVYTAALGYVDLCVAQYSITDARASSASWFLLESQPLYLIVMGSRGNSWEKFLDSLSTIFKPFTPGTWMFIILFMIPVLGVLMVVHEYGRAGSGYPRYEEVVRVPPTQGEGDHNDDNADDDDSNHGNGGNSDSSSVTASDDDHEQAPLGHSRGLNGTTGGGGGGSGSQEDFNDDASQPKIEERKVPFYRHILKSIYINLLSTLQQSYDQSIVTYGGMFHLLGISFFILTIIAVYTANLAAILTQKAQRSRIDGFESAIRAGYTFCGERKNVQTITNLYDIDNLFITDPVELGGDGKPGFNCDDCMSRRRVFDFMDPTKVGDGLHCDAAVAPLEDLQVMQHDGVHCNKTSVGEPVTYVQTGMPVYDGVSRELVSLFLKMKNDGVLAKELFVAEPESRCAPLEGGEEGEALSIEELTGVWTVTFCFAMIGLIVTYAQPRLEERMKRKGKHIERVDRYDQSGSHITKVAPEDVGVIA